MTLKEAKKILEKEFVEIGFHKSTEPFEFDESRWFVGEKPEVLDAFRVLSKEGYYIAISGHDYDMRKARLGRPTDKPSSDTPSTLNPALKEAASQFNDALLDEQEKKIAEQNKEITRLLSLVEKKENSISRLYYEKSVLEKENEELKKGEIPAKYFDKALVDEQAEKIKKLEHEKLDILEMASSCKQTVTERGKEISRLNGIIHDKNAVLSDVAEELRLTKIREKNLTEVCQKYMKENEELKKELADKVVDKIDAQALKSAESALAWKEKVVTYKDMTLAYYEKKINEKDEVIADLGNELAATKKELEAFKESYKRRIKEDSEHFEHIQKICNAGLQKWLIESEYLEKDKPFCSPVKDNHPTEDNPEEVEVDEILEYVRKALEKGHTVSIDYDKAEEGGDQSATIVECGKDIDDVFEEIKRLWQE